MQGYSVAGGNITRVLILNCDYDRSPKTNGALLLRGRLAAAGISAVTVKNIFRGAKVTAADIRATDAVLITGSRAPAYERKKWILYLGELVRKLDSAGIPVLGVCFGFQMVAQSLGGKVARAASGEEGFGRVTLTPAGREDWLFEGMPSKFQVYQSHNDVVTRLPKGATKLASNGHSIQAYSVRGFRCVQFHPEIGVSAARTMAIRDGRPAALGVNSDYTTHYEVISNFIMRLKKK
ncbi:MAG TPA: type 1 glutamine amidotransferase [Candidatus Acidoferrales bacterium]|nr:type 1 glutamine amidotransferase [Candidatus Acidoferrales bacterium]